MENLLELPLRQVPLLNLGKRLRKMKEPQPCWEREKLTLPFKGQLKEVRTGTLKEES